jgi:hypothetical protein
MLDDTPLPIFPMLERHGLLFEALGDIPNPERLALAVQRCAMCGDKALAAVPGSLRAIGTSGRSARMRALSTK